MDLEDVRSFPWAISRNLSEHGLSLLPILGCIHITKYLVAESRVPNLLLVNYKRFNFSKQSINLILSSMQRPLRDWQECFAINRAERLQTSGRPRDRYGRVTLLRARD